MPPPVEESQTAVIFVHVMASERTLDDMYVQ